MATDLTGGADSEGIGSIEGRNAAAPTVVGIGLSVDADLIARREARRALLALAADTDGVGATFTVEVTGSAGLGPAGRLATHFTGITIFVLLARLTHPVDAQQAQAVRPAETWTAGAVAATGLAYRTIPRALTGRTGAIPAADKAPTIGAAGAPAAGAILAADLTGRAATSITGVSAVEALTLAIDTILV
jgi:hypothetical protein